MFKGFIIWLSISILTLLNTYILYKYISHPIDKTLFFSFISFILSWILLLTGNFIYNLIFTAPKKMFNEWNMKEEGSKAASEFYELDDKYAQIYRDDPISGQSYDVYRRIELEQGKPYYQEVEKLLKEHKCFNEQDIRRFADGEFLRKKYGDQLNEARTPLGLARYLYMTDLLDRFGNLTKNI